MKLFRKDLAEVLKPLQKMKEGLAKLQQRNSDENIKKSGEVAVLESEIKANDIESEQAAIAANNLEALATINLVPESAEEEQ